MRMLCYKCNHPWTYKGTLSEGKIYVTCPNCMRKIRIDRALVEDSSEQRLLTSISKKDIKTTSFPLELPTTTSFIEVEKDIFVEKKIAKQFKEAPEETANLFQEQEEESAIKILPPKFKIIRIIPRDPIKLLEHMKNY